MYNRRRSPARLASTLAAVSLAAGASAAMAQETPRKSQSPALDNISLWVGAYSSSNQTTLGARIAGLNRDAKLNLENDLDFKKRKTVPRARLDFLIGAHQGFTFDYYSVDRSHSKTFSDAVNFLGTPINADARVKGDLTFSFGSAAYRWWFGTGDDVLGLGIGAAYYKVDASLSAAAAIGGSRVDRHVGAGTSAVAPNVQIGWRHAFNDQFRLYVNVSGVKKSGGELNGHIVDAALGLEWFPWHNLGVGAEYAYTKIHLSQDKRNYGLDFDMKLNGPAAYLRLRF